jgi:hypothetical protein
VQKFIIQANGQMDDVVGAHDQQAACNSDLRPTHLRLESDCSSA